MNSLGTPVIDALALDYLGFSFLPVVINNIWTWVAVITAAVSFWRIRAVSLKSDSQDESSPAPLMVSVSPPPHTEEKEAVMEPVTTLASSTTTTSSAVDVDTTGGPTRGKFTVYYYEDESEGEVAWEGGMDEEGGGVAEVSRGTGGDYWCDNWEKVMRMRVEGDMGWHRYQDLTVLDGNVVRLWDGSRDKSTVAFFFNNNNNN